MARDESLDRTIEACYRRHLGRPGRRFTIDDLPAPAPNPIAALEFPPSSADDCWSYATVGASRAPMPTPKTLVGRGAERIELLILSDRRRAELPRLLASLVAYPFCNRTYLGAEHTIPGLKGVIAGSPLTDVLLVAPGWGVLHHADDDHTLVLCVVPISPSERLFKVQHGYAAFFDLLAANETDVTDLTRPPIV